jgi:hypothetical protein
MLPDSSSILAHESLQSNQAVPAAVIWVLECIAPTIGNTIRIARRQVSSLPIDGAVCSSTFKSFKTSILPDPIHGRLRSDCIGASPHVPSVGVR